VFIAQARSSGSHRDVEDEELTRIFVMIPKTFTEDDLKETFKVVHYPRSSCIWLTNRIGIAYVFITHLFSQEYGDIEYCIIVKNKTTGESKGLGYVRYHKPSQAATAIENCEKSKLSLFIHITCL
jgi:RNA recognition motif-containing protein